MIDVEQGVPAPRPSGKPDLNREPNARQQGPQTPAPLHELMQFPHVAGLQQTDPASPQSASPVHPWPQNELPATV